MLALLGRRLASAAGAPIWPPPALRAAVAAAPPAPPLLPLRWLALRPASTDASASSSSSPAASPAPPALALSARTPPPPWTPTHELVKRKAMPKRMGHMLSLLEAEAVEAATAARAAASGGGGATPLPAFRAGDVLEVRLALPDARRRVTVLRGVCIGRRNRGLRSSFDLLNYVPGGGPVHRTLPLHSPLLQGVRVVERRGARRAKLYYLKQRNPKEYRV